MIPKKKDFLKISFAALILLLFITAWLGFGDRGFIHLHRMEKERNKYEEKIRQLEKENAQLLEEIDRLHNDKEYIESIARKELGLVREDEIIYRFDKDHEDSTTSENN